MRVTRSRKCFSFCRNLLQNGDAQNIMGELNLLWQRIVVYVTGVKFKMGVNKLPLIFASATAFSFLIVTLINHLNYKNVSLRAGKDGRAYRGYNRDVELNNETGSGVLAGRSLSLANFDRIEREFEGRRERVSSQCSSIAEEEMFQLNDIFLSNMLIDLKHQLSWCPIYKVASSMWMKNFAVLGEVWTGPIIDLINRNVIEIRTVARRASQHLKLNEIREKFNETKKFLIVRHPLERLVSAYRDKLESKIGREYYYERYGRHIVARYGKSVRKNESDVPSAPTFAEFLEFIANERRFDEHWRPFYEACRPCAVKYDYILKLETYDVDEKYLLQDTGLSQYLYDGDNFRNANPRGCTDKSLVRDYIRRVPHTILKQIVKIYEKDFKLFSYSLDYLN